MNLLQDLRDAIVAKLRTAWGAAGTLVMFVTPLASLAFRGSVPPEVSNLLPFIVLLSVAAFLMLAWAGSYTWHAVFAGSDHISLPEAETVSYAVFPYRADSHLRTLTSRAQQVFEGDTMKADVVQHAVATKCAVGVRLTDGAGRNIGFIDVFRLSKDALRLWLAGELSEPDLKEDDFVPLAQAGESSETLELILGAIYIDPKVAKIEPSLAFQLAELAEQYIWTSCAEWQDIRIYSSIFSDSGERMAALYGFTKSVFKHDRKGPAADHDVWVRTIRRNDPPRVVRGLGGRRNIIMELKPV